MTPTIFTTADLQEQLREVERELAVRDFAYPRLIARGRLTPATAAYQVRVLENVAVTLRQVLAQTETAITNPLFALDGQEEAP